MLEPVSQPFHEVRPPRFVHAIALAATAGLVSAFVWFLFLRDVPEGDEPDLMMQIVGGAATVVGVFLIGVFLRRLMMRPASFWCGEEGFVYQPGGVSTGLVRWSDIKELRDIGVQVAAQTHENAVAVVLHDPAAYIARQAGWLQPLFRKRARLSGSPLVLRATDLGRDYVRVKAMMAERVRRAQAR